MTIAILPPDGAQNGLQPQSAPHQAHIRSLEQEREAVQTKRDLLDSHIRNHASVDALVTVHLQYARDQFDAAITRLNTLIDDREISRIAGRNSR